MTGSKHKGILPSATPTEAELVAWAALPRDEQVHRYQEALAHPDCSEPSNENMHDILTLARQRVAARANG
jgi:hypothetical protein